MTSVRNETAAALATYENALLAPPGPLDRDRESLEGLLTRLEELRERQPRSPEIQFEIGRIRSKLGHWEAGLESMNEAIEALQGRAPAEFFHARAVAAAERWLEVPFFRDARRVSEWRVGQERAAQDVEADIRRAVERGFELSAWRAHFFRGFARLADYDHDSCQEVCRAALRIPNLAPSQRADLLLLHGISRLLANRGDESRAAFDEAALLKRRDVRALLGVVINRLEGSGPDIETGLRVVEQILLIDPEYAAVQLPAGCLLAGAGTQLQTRGEDPWPLYERALAAFERAWNTTGVVYALTRATTLRLTRAEWLRSRGEHASARVEYRRALELAQRLRETDASQHCAEIVAIQSRLMLARLDGAADEPSLREALQELDRIHESLPSAGDVLIQRARVSAHLAELPRRENSSDPFAHWRRAERDLTAAIEGGWGSAAVYEDRGSIRWRRFRADDTEIDTLEACEHDFTRALELDPTRVASRIRRGAVRRTRALRIGDMALLRRALGDLERAVSEAPRHAGARVEFGEVLLALHDSKGALEQFAKAAELQPELATPVRARIKESD